jgi:uncharacterized protein YhaN
VRIEHLLFERYGLFTDRRLDFRPGAALHLVLGANEAGKTSALSAIGDWLFGFGGRTDYDFRHPSNTLRIGGRLRHSDGRTVEARRRKGNKNTLIDADDQPLPDDLLAKCLAGVSREAFGREFGLTAQALREGGHQLLNAGGRLAETLAASSAGMAALSRIRSGLQDEADELFTPRRSGSKPFYIAAERREAADRALRDAIVTRESIEQAEAALAESRSRLEQLNAAHAEVGGNLARLERTRRVSSKLAQLHGIANELAALAGLPNVSPQTLEGWQAAMLSHAALESEIARLDSAAVVDAAEIASLAVDEPLLAQGVAIDALRERLGAVRKALDDLPRRRQARDLAQATLDDAARRLGLRSHVELVASLPTDPALALARDLIDQARRAGQATADAAARHARALQERDDLAAEAAEAPVIADIDQLRQRFDALGDLPGQADRMRRDTTALDLETTALTSAVAALDPTPGALDRLRALPLPDSGTIAKYAHAAEIGDTEAKRLAEKVTAADGEIAASEAELARLSSAGEVSTRADLIDARASRDVQLNALRAALDADMSLRERQLDHVVRASDAVDRVTDLLLADTERATRAEDARQRLADWSADRDRHAAKLATVQARLAEVDAAWRQSWGASGLAPRSPPEMIRWRERMDELLARVERLDAHKAERDALAASVEVGRAAALSFLEAAGRAPDRSLAPELLYREARLRLDQLQAAWADARERAARQRMIHRDLSEAEAARAAADNARDAVRRAWPAAMAGIGQSEGATLAEAEAALAVWQSVPVPQASFEREGRSVETIEADLHAFEHDVWDIVGRVAPQLQGVAAQDCLAQLADKLATARRDTETCRRLKDTATKRMAQRDDLLGKRAATETVLSEACQTLSVSGISALPELLTRLGSRHLLETDEAALRRDLETIADGRDEAALLREREGVDLDQLRGAIAREEVRQQQLLDEIKEASAIEHQAKNERDTLLKGRDAAAAAAERAEASAELISIAERWLLRAAAARLAGRAIERHRAMVQDPLIARASTLFALASGEAFSGLGVDYGDDDQPVLVARRPDGERVAVAGLSEGSRDQLFLALRLALLERRTAEPMPFIGDDLLTSFDDSRTLATLRLLASTGAQRQVILFTHHRHVVDIARSLQDHAIDVIDL